MAVRDAKSPELVALFEAYTAGDRTIGGDLQRLAVEAMKDQPLIVATATDIALYPGGGRAPDLLAFRLSTRGFKELAGISHLGPAIASLVDMRRTYADQTVWRSGAERLRAALGPARAANAAELWRDRIAVEAFRGREEAIAALVDYACGVTDRMLAGALDDENRLDPDFVRREYLEAKGDAIGASVPFNLVMIATFFLVGMDIAFRANRWFRKHDVDWSNAQVLIAGQQGRPTAGVTWTSNSIAQIILAASGHTLPLDRLYVAPHAPTFTVKSAGDFASVREMEAPLRQLWAFTRAVRDLGKTMFEGYPAFGPECVNIPTLGPGTQRLGEMPRIAGPDDIRTMTTRLRLVMEDPRQLLSGCVTDFAAEQLRATDNDPARVVVPGLDDVDYPMGL